MVDMNNVIAENIAGFLKKQNKKQTDLADALGTNKQTVTKITAEYIDPSIVHVFMGKVQSE